MGGLASAARKDRVWQILAVQNKALFQDFPCPMESKATRESWDWTQKGRDLHAPAHVPAHVIDRKIIRCEHLCVAPMQSPGNPRYFALSY